MGAPASFYWHDYETWGQDPRRDRAAQFAGVRTDADFEVIGRPLVVYARPADDLLPQPGACLVTGLTPQVCVAEGLPEAEFFRVIHEELAQPGTCALGYNSLRFDDQFTRFGLYRNFFDPYAREWQGGNSRWDLIDLVRLTRALRPEGIEWPVHDDGSPSFRLEALTAANGIEHTGAHDALADVWATLGLARLLRARQPKLFDYLLQHRDKAHLGKVLDPALRRPVLHVSSRYPARLGCLAAVLPLVRLPSRQHAVVVYDLREDPTPLLTLSADEIHARVFSRQQDLEARGERRIPLKLVHANRSPVIVPMGTITAAARAEWAMPEAAERQHLAALQAAPAGLAAKLVEVFSRDEFAPSSDPDGTLYDGFSSPLDQRLAARVRELTPAQLARAELPFDDPKWTELLFRYRARNWPESLSAAERQRWELYRRQRLTEPGAGASITLADYRRELARLAVDPTLSAQARQVVDALIDWPEALGF